MFYLRSNEGKTLEEIEEEIRRKELLEQQALTADVGAVLTPEIPAYVPSPVVSDTALTQPGSYGGSRRMPSTPAFVSGMRTPSLPVDAEFAIPEINVTDYDRRRAPALARDQALIADIGFTPNVYTQPSIDTFEKLSPTPGWIDVLNKQIRPQYGDVVGDLAAEKFTDIDAGRRLSDEEVLMHDWGIGVQGALNNTLLAKDYLLQAFGSDKEESIRMRQAFRNQLSMGGFDPNKYVPNTLSKTTQAIAHSSLVSLATAGLAITAGLPVALAGMYSQVFIPELDANLSGGMEPKLAVEAAIVSGLTETLTEIPILRVLRGIPGSDKAISELAFTLAKGGTFEGGAEAFGQIMQDLHAIARLGKNISAKDIESNALLAFVTGGVSGTAMVGGTSAVAGLGQVLQNTLQRTDRSFAPAKVALAVGLNNDPNLNDERNALRSFLEKRYGDSIDIVEGVHPIGTKNGGPTFNPGMINPETGRSQIHIDDIIMNARNAKEARLIAKIAVRHEGGHELLQNENEIRDKFFADNNTDIIDWLSKSEEYEWLHNLVQNPNENDNPLELQRLATEEYINNTAENDVKLSGRVGLAVLEFVRNMGVSVSSDANARLLIKDLMAGNVDKLRASAKAGGLQSKSRRDFMRKMGLAGAGIVVDPSVILKPTTPELVPGDPFVQQLADVVVPNIDTIYKFDIAADPYEYSLPQLSGVDPGEQSMEVAFNYKANQELIEVYEGEELVDTINTAGNQKDIDALIIQYVNDEYGRRNVNSVYDPIRDPAGEAGDAGGPLTESEMDKFFSAADTNYKQQAQDMVAGRLERRIESGQRESFSQMTEEGMVRIPKRSSAYDYFDESTTPRLPESTTPRLKEYEENEAAKATAAAEKVPQKWRELETSSLELLMEENRAAGNLIWRAMNKELEGREAADEAAATEVEEFETMGLEQARLEKQKVLEETHRILDNIEEAQRESLDSGTLSAQDRKSIKLAPDMMKLRRDTQNFVQKQKILERLEGDALELGKLVHRLNGVPHMKGRQSIGLETAPLDRDGFRTIMTDLVKGDTASAEAFIEGERAILQQIQDAKQEAQVSKAQAAYAERVGKDRTALAPRRKKGTVSPLEGIMTPVLAKQEIDAQLEADVIDQATYDQKLDRIEEIQQTVRGTVAKGRALTKAAIGEDLLGVIDLQTMKDQAEILKRDTNIPIRAKQQRPKAEVREEHKAAVTEGAKVTRIPADPDAAIKGKIDFDKGTTKREQRYGLENIAADADIFTELDDMRTEQGEELGEGYSEVLERKSIKAVEGESYKDKKKRGSITITKVHDDGTVEYEMTTPKGVTTGQRGKEGFDTFINTFYQDYAVASRASKPFIEWAKQHPEYQKEKYWDGDKVVVGEFVENFDKLWNDATLAGVKVPTDVARLESELRSDRDPGIRQIKNKVRDMNTEYESFLGKGVFTPDHLSELLGFEIIGDVATGKDVVYSSPTSNMHAANNLAIMPKLVHDAVNAWIKAGRTASERAIRKNSPNKYTGMINDAAFIASNSKYKNIPDFIRAVGKLGNMTNAREIEMGLLNATATLLEKDASNAPWNKDGWKATPTPQDALLVDNAQNTYKRLSVKLRKDDPKHTSKITADFTSGTMRTLFQYIFGAPVKRIADFNKMSAFGVGEQGTITAATMIANAIQRSLSSQARPEGMEQGTDLVQETSLRSGEFYSRLFKVFAGVTNNEGIITPKVNAQIVDYIAGKPVEFTSKNIEKAAKELKTFMEDIYQYAKDRTSSLKTPLDLRGAGDSVLPRVWNIDYIATRRGKKEFLAAIANKFTDPKGKLVFEDAGVTPEDLYAVVVNSGGFVQGEWTNIKADQTTSKAEIEKDQLMQEYLDSLSTEELADAGLLVDDLQSVIPRFVQKAVERTEYSAVFGVNDEILRSLVQMGVDQIKVHNESVMKMEEGGPNNLIDDKAFQKAVWDMSKILRNKFGYDMADMPTRKWLQRIANVEVVAKLPLVTLASLPEFFTPMLKGDVRPDKFAIDFALASAWAGYKAMNGLSKLVFNTHLPAMLKHSSKIEGLGIISDIQLLREMGIADIQSMGDTVATRYANPNFARGGIRAATKGTVGARIPKGVRAVFNMQTYMQATMLTTITEMQQFMALRNYQRHMMERVNFVNKNKGKALKGRSAVRLRQYKQDLLDYGVTEDMDLSTPEGEAAFNAGALRFIDQVITRPNDATTAKIFKNPLTAPLVLFKRFITTYGNTLLTSVGTDFATKVDNVERAKQVGKLSVAAAGMYGAVIFAEILRGAIKGDLDEDDFKVKPEDWKTFMRRVDRMGVLSAPGSVAANLSFPSKAWYGDTGTNRMVRELTGPFGSDIAGTLDFVMSKKGEKDLHSLLKQVSPTAGMIVPKPQSKRKSNYKKKRYPNTYAE